MSYFNNFWLKLKNLFGTKATTIKTSTMGKKLYVLCVGINEYKATNVGNLESPVPDSQKVFDYLQEAAKDTDYEFVGKRIINEQATKDGIVEASTTHFSNLTSEDVAVFYYTGHGAEEEADEVFHKFSARPLLGTIVCHDSRTDGVTDLADKELRYLTHKVTQNNPHFVAIMDSCHSGESFRNELTPKLTGASPKRAWKDFIFAKEKPRSVFENIHDLSEALPIGKYIQLASSQSDELSYEFRDQSIYTKHLLEILERSSGKVSYSTINSRIRLLLKGKFKQTPVYDDKGNFANQQFLGGAIKTQGMTASLVFDKEEFLWVLDKGAIHGIYIPEEGEEGVEIRVMEGGKLLTTVEIKEVLGNSTIIVTPENNILSRQFTYDVEVVGGYKNPLNIWITGEQEGVDILKKYFGGREGDIRKKADNIQFIEDMLLADYALRAENGYFIITNTADNKPLVEQQSYNGKSSLNNLSNYLSQIATWEFVRKLDNPRTRLMPTPPMSIDVFKVKNNENIALKAEGDEVHIIDGDRIRIQLENHTRNKKLFHHALLMSMDFGIIPLKGSAFLEPEKKYFVEEGYAIPYEIDKYVKDFKFKESFAVLKLIVSTAPFKIDDFSYEPLPHPVFPEPTPSDGHRKIKRKKTPERADWTTYSVRVVVEVQG